MTTLQDQTESTTTFDDAHLNNLIAAVRIELEERARWIHQQAPVVDRYDLRLVIEARSDGSSDPMRNRFTVWTLTNGEFSIAGVGENWTQAADRAMDEAINRKLVADKTLAGVQADLDSTWRCAWCGNLNTARQFCLKCFAKRCDNPLPTSELEAMCSTDTQNT